MNTEQKAKAYDKVREKIALRFGSNVAEEIFSEIEMSKDERIRKAIIELVRQSSEILEKKNQEQMISWLKNQGEQKPADEVKPKFHEGEWITNGDYTWKIVEVKPLDYILQSQDGNIVDDTISYVDEPFHLWTIEDAKDGDVLACESGWTCIFKTLVNDENFSSYCFMDNTKWFCETGSECHTLKEEFVKAYNGKIYPATKEQRDLLFQKMHEAGYMWDSKSKQLLSLKAEPSGKQKPAGWSEEDEKRLKSCLDILQPKTLLGNTETINTKWLKSLKQRIGWKPSEEQMKALDSVIDEYDGYPEFDSLVSLKNDLKKL